MSSKSNDNGRALEFKIVDTFHCSNKNVKLLEETQTYQDRDIIKYQNLPINLKKKFKDSANKFFNWFNLKYNNPTIIQINRLSDNSGLVQDVEINSINFSIKHNHFALKHPRPYSLASQCGYTKSSNEDIKHRKEMQLVADIFRKKTKGNATYKEDQIALEDLYSDVNQVCKKSLDFWCKNDPNAAYNFFNFIVGVNFYKLIILTKKKDTTVEIQDFFNIPQPKTLICKYDPKQKNYLKISFDNNWTVKLRLHSASTNISEKNQLSLKFDAQKESGKVEIIDI